MITVKRLSVVAILAIVISVSSTPTQGYVNASDKWPSGSNIILQLQLGSSPRLQDGSTSWGQAFEAAMGVWSAVLNSIRLSAVRDSTAAKASFNGISNIFFDSTIYGDTFGSRTLAVTVRIFRGTVTEEGDIIFNTSSSITWDSYRGRLQSATDFRRVAIHELGHLMGLRHPDENGQSVSAIMNAFVSDLDTIQPDDIAGIQNAYGGGVSGNVSFPPRNEPADFYLNTLIPLYRDVLRAAQVSTNIDAEGLVIWVTEYVRQRVGQCDHAAATQRTLAQITGSGGTLVCALTPAGAIAFAPRDQTLLFMIDLETTYRVTLGRPTISTFVNAEGAVVWVVEYLRYRLNGCGHGDSVTKVVTQIRGGGIQPTCR